MRISGPADAATRQDNSGHDTRPDRRACDPATTATRQNTACAQFPAAARISGLFPCLFLHSRDTGHVRVTLRSQLRFAHLSTSHLLYGTLEHAHDVAPFIH